MKTCTKCGGEPKPVSEFGKQASRRDGLRPWCKACENAANAARYAANPAKQKAANAAWRAVNPEKVYAVNSKWQKANQNKTKAYNAKFQAANPDKVRASNAKWYSANSDKKKAVNAIWRAANPEANRIWLNNRRARKLENGGRLSPGLAAKLFKLQRGKCACCHVSIEDGNHMDHRMPLALGGPNEDWNMQLLCGPCNLQKGAKHPVDFMQQRGNLI